MNRGPDRSYPRCAVGRRLLLLTTALQAVPMLAPVAVQAQPAPNARPLGGQVVAGQAAIAQTAARTTVSQTSQRAAVDWKSFDVGSSHAVRFAQPNASAVTLNRVTGPNPSEIAGQIQANGQVVIVNQAGVLFHKGAQIDTAGLVASAVGISNGNFMAGRMVFDQPASPGARVENRGSITIRDRGLAALVAPQVANSGVITARMGTVVLAGAEAHTLDLYGDGMVGINVTRQVRTAPDGTKALVTNTGTIVATGGTVVLTAEAVDGVVQTLVNAGGHIAAATTGGRTGRIVAAGRGGDVIVTGTMAANGTDPGTTGGSVTVNATGTVGLGAQARVSASGSAGGGTIAIGTTQARVMGNPKGGNPQGGNPKGSDPTGGGPAGDGPTVRGPATGGQDTARYTLISRGARIEADATGSGRGGLVTVLSTGVTRMEGSISALGISRGGAVEVSGRHVSSADGRIDVGASAGPVGTILIDPDFLDIVSGVAGSGSQDMFVAGGTILATAGSVPPDTVSTGVLNALVGDVVLQANQTISVKGDITLTNTPTQALVLEAGGTITIDPGVRITTNGDVTLATGGAGPISPPAGRDSPLISLQGTVLSNTGSVSLLAGAGGSITIGGSIIAGTILLDAPAGIALTGLASVGQFAGAITLRSSGGGVRQDFTARLVAGRLDAPDGIAGQVFLGGPNVVQSLGTFTVAGDGNSLILVNAVDIAIDGPLTVPHNIGIATTSTERITINGTIANTTGALAMIAGSGGIVLNSGASVPIGRIGMTSANTISLAAGARLGVDGALIDLATSAGGVAQAAGATIIAGRLQSTRGITGDVLLQPGNTITALGGMAITAGRLTLDSTSDLAVVGPVSASGPVALRSDGQITLFDSVISGGSATLHAGGGLALEAFSVLDAPSITLSAAGPIRLATGGRVGSAGTTLDVTTTAGGVDQDVSGTITAASLVSTGGIAGDLSLPGQNTIASVGSLSVGGSVMLHDTAPLTVTGTIATGGDAYLRVSDTAGITIDSAGAVVTGAGRRADLHAQRLRVTGTVVAGAFAFAPETSGTPMSLGGTASAIDSLLRVSATDATIGGVMVPGTGSVVTAGPISVTAAFDANGMPLRLLSLGGIDASAAPLQRVASLSGTAGGSVRATHAATGIGGLGPFTVTGTNADLAVATTTALPVTGPVSATRDVALSAAGDIGLGGTIAAGRTLLVSALGGAISSANANLTAPSIRFTSLGSIALGSATVLGQAGAVVDLTAGAGGVTQHPGGRIEADRLLSAGGIVGDLSLASPSNRIGTLGAIGATGDIHIVSPGTDVIAGPLASPLAGPTPVPALGTGLTVAGIVAAGGTATLAGGPILVAGGAAVTGTAVVLDASGPITLNAGSVVSAPSGRVTLRTGAGGISQATGGTLLADRLVAAAPDGVVLVGAANRIATLDSVSVTGFGAGFTLSAADPLRIEGPVLVQDGVSVAAPGITVAGSVATGGVVALTAGTEGLAVTGAGTVTGTAITLRAASPISMDAGGVIGQAGAMIDLSASAGGITQHAGARILGRLRSSDGVTGDVLLLGTTNAITELGDFAVTAGRFHLKDGATTLTVPGSVSAGAIDVEAGSIAITGTIAALSGGATLRAAADATHTGLLRGVAVTIDAGAAIASSGTIEAGPSGLALGAGGGITQSGGLLTSASAAVLSANGDVTQSAGTIAAGGPITLTAGGGVTQSGTLLTTNGGLVSLSGATITQSVSGLIAASETGGTIRMTADQSIRTDGTLIAPDASAGTITLLANGGSADEFPLTVNGRLIAGFGVSGTAAIGSVSLGADITAGMGGAVFSTIEDLRVTSGTVIMPVAFSVITPGSFIQQQGTLRASSLSVTAQGGDIIQSPGAALLSGDRQGRVDLLASGRIDLAGLVTANDPASGAVTLRAGGGVGSQAIMQSGTIRAGRSIALTAMAGDIVHGGTSVADGVAIATVVGHWSQPSGLIQSRATQVAVTATGTASQGAGALLTAPNAIAFAAGQGIDQAGTLTTQGGVISLLTNAGGLRATGALTASQVRITNLAGQIVVGGRIDGLAPAAQQAGSQFVIPARDFPTRADQAGVFVTTGASSLGQTIAFTADIAATEGRGQVLIAIPNDANLSLRAESRNADLFLALQRGPASGLVRVGSLHVRYDGKGTTGIVDLAGSVDGLSGYTAAAAAFILPSLLPNYQLNGCAIQSVSCFQISDLRVPVSNPLKDVQSGGGGSAGGTSSLLPDVAERDY